MKLWITFFWNILFTPQKMNDGGIACFPKSIWKSIMFCMIFKILVAFFYLIYTGMWCKVFFLESFKLHVANLIFWKWFHISKQFLASKPLKFLWFITLIFPSYYKNDPSCLFKNKTAFIKFLWKKKKNIMFKYTFLLNWILKSLRQWCIHFS